MKKIDMVGRKFGKLLVVSLSPNTSGKRRRLLYCCNCDCGKTNVEVTGEKLRSGATKSCGCLVKETASLTHKKYNEYDLSKDYGIGTTLNTNRKFYFDLEDYWKIKNYCWLELESGYIASRNSATGKFIYLHRLVTGATNNEVVDHKSHAVYDNRKTNLRKSTQCKNMMNTSMRSDNTSGFTGVYYNKERNKWIAEIISEKKKVCLGLFENKQEAIKARRDAEEQYFMDWSYKNSTGHYNNE